MAVFEMESLITAAPRALEAGDPLRALNRVALRDDAPALALRGIALVQHGREARVAATSALSPLDVLPLGHLLRGGLFLLKKSKILGMNQDRRSGSSSRKRFDHPATWIRLIKEFGSRELLLICRGST